MHLTFVVEPYIADNEEFPMTDKKPTPPYISYKTFQGQIHRLLDETTGTLPSHIDSSALKKMAGSTSNQFQQALRFFDLVGKDYAKTTALEELAKSNNDKWKTLIRPMIQAKYHKHLEVLKSGTVARLKDSFTETFEGTAILPQAMRFLVAAADDVGLPIAAVIKDGIPSNRNAGTSRGSRKTPQPPTTNQQSTSTSNQGGFEVFPIKFGATHIGSLSISPDPEETEIEFFFMKVELIKAQLLDRRKHPKPIPTVPTGKKEAATP